LPTSQAQSPRHYALCIIDPSRLGRGERFEEVSASSVAVPFLFLLSSNPPKCLPPTSDPAPTYQALRIRPFLTKKDTLNVSLAGTECANSLLSSIPLICVKISKTSAIWHHSGERRRLDDHSMERYWRCAYCKGSATILKVAGGNGG
jgi:hypothetical protein